VRRHSVMILRFQIFPLRTLRGSGRQRLIGFSAGEGAQLDGAFPDGGVAIAATARDRIVLRVRAGLGLRP
jgi:hypothetical protein